MINMYLATLQHVTDSLEHFLKSYVIMPFTIVISKVFDDINDKGWVFGLPSTLM